jgi:hypothetical protein
MMIPSIFLCFVLAGADDPVKDEPKASNEPLRQELLAMFKEDQELRQKLVEWMQSNPQGGVNKLDKKDGMPAEIKKLQDLDKKNTARLKKIIEQHGWPGYSHVGRDGANAAWLLVQHADHDRPFQKKCLTLMEGAAKKGEASKQNLAYLTDRVLIGEGKKQRYGSQFMQKDGDWVPQPIEDEANVDKRRADVGLPTLAEYKKMIKEAYQGKGEKKQ